MIDFQKNLNVQSDPRKPAYQVPVMNNETSDTFFLTP